LEAVTWRLVSVATCIYLHGVKLTPTVVSNTRKIDMACVTRLVLILPCFAVTSCRHY